MYMVESQTQEDTYYLVDMRLNFCECAAGSSKGSCKHKVAVMKHFNCAEFAVIPVNDYRAQAAYHYIATGQRLDASHYRELNQVEIPEDIDQCIEDHRAQVHQDPAVLEEVDPEVNDAEDDNDADAANDVDADHIPELGDIEDVAEDDSEDDVEEIWAAFKSAQEVFESKIKNAIQDKNFRKFFKKYTSSVQKVGNS